MKLREILFWAIIVLALVLVGFRALIGRGTL